MLPEKVIKFKFKVRSTSIKISTNIFILIRLKANLSLIEFEMLYITNTKNNKKYRIK